MHQVGRALTAADDGLLRHHRLLICDRDRKWSGEVPRLLHDVGIRVVQTPRQAPNANAYAERFVRSMKEHGERNHQGLKNALIVGVPSTGSVGRIRRRPRLGGLLNYYQRAA